MEDTHGEVVDFCRDGYRAEKGLLCTTRFTYMFKPMIADETDNFRESEFRAYVNPSHSGTQGNGYFRLVRIWVLLAMVALFVCSRLNVSVPRAQKNFPRSADDQSVRYIEVHNDASAERNWNCHHWTDLDLRLLHGGRSSNGGEKSACLRHSSDSLEYIYSPHRKQNGCGTCWCCWRARNHNADHHVAAAKGKEWNFIRHKHGFCLDAGGNTVHLWKCNRQNKAQHWKYDPETRMLINVGGCLILSNTTKQEIAVVPCAQISTVMNRGLWSFVGVGSGVTRGYGLWKLNTESAKCLYAPTVSSAGAPVELRKCGGKLAAFASRRWQMVKSSDPAVFRKKHLHNRAVYDFYLYRAQSDENYPLENANAGDLNGVLWYLNNEVVTLCPRKYAITRILRFRLNAAAKSSEGVFGPFTAFDNGQCTAWQCAEQIRDDGATVGCQPRWYGPLPGHWYSLPGPCPSKPNGQKDLACMRHEPGGACDVVTGNRHCTFHIEPAGELSVDDLTGITNYTRFCAEGKFEYNRELDRGIGFNFWDGLNDALQVRRRSQSTAEAFDRTYPDLPSSFDLAAPLGC